MREFFKHYAMVSTMDVISETFIDFNDNMDPQVYWYDNSDSIEYTTCIGDYPINEDDARSERILLTSAHDGITTDE